MIKMVNSNITGFHGLKKSIESCMKIAAYKHSLGKQDFLTESDKRYFLNKSVAMYSGICFLKTETRQLSMRISACKYAAQIQEKRGEGYHSGTLRSTGCSIEVELYKKENSFTSIPHQFFNCMRLGFNENPELAYMFCRESDKNREERKESSHGVSQ